MQTGRSDLSLSGITVVSFEEAIAEPLASRHLADWGARVITTFDTMRSGDLNQTSY